MSLLLEFGKCIECDPVRAVMEDFSIRTGRAVDDLMLSDVQSLYSNIPDVVEREFERADRITDRMGE